MLTTHYSLRITHHSLLAPHHSPLTTYPHYAHSDYCTVVGRQGQRTLVTHIAAAGVPVVLVLVTGRPRLLKGIEDLPAVGGLLQAFLPVRASQPTTRYQLPTARYTLPTTHYPLPAIRYPQLATQSSPITCYHVLLNTNSTLNTQHVLLTAHWLPHTTHYEIRDTIHGTHYPLHTASARFSLPAMLPLSTYYLLNKGVARSFTSSLHYSLLHSGLLLTTLGSSRRQSTYRVTPRHPLSCWSPPRVLAVTAWPCPFSLLAPRQLSVQRAARVRRAVVFWKRHVLRESRHFFPLGVPYHRWARR